MIKLFNVVKGFVLIELIIVTAILGFVSAIGTTALVSYSRSQKLQTATNDLGTILNIAKSNSFSQIKDSSLCSNVEPLEGYKVVIGCSTYDLNVVCGGVEHNIMNTKPLPDNVMLGNNSPMSVFFPILKSQVSGSGIIPLTGHGQTRCIQIDPAGVISHPSICPVPAACSTPTPIPTITPTPPPSAPPPCGTFGELDGDGLITNSDANLIADYLVGAVILTPQQIIDSDVDGDGLLTIGDALVISNYIVGNIPTFPSCGAPTPVITTTPTSTPSPTPVVARVFASSQVYTGNLGGLSGADAKCQNLADNASGGPLGGTWKAWLSDSTTNAKDRITDQEYRLVAGGAVALSLADLTDNSIASMINKNEDGVGVSGVEVWTATKADGTRESSFNCVDWTSSSPIMTGWVGELTSADSNWTKANFTTICDATWVRLYCFMQ